MTLSDNLVERWRRPRTTEQPSLDWARLQDAWTTLGRLLETAFSGESRVLLLYSSPGVAITGGLWDLSAKFIEISSRRIKSPPAFLCDSHFSLTKDETNNATWYQNTRVDFGDFAWGTSCYDSHFKPVLGAKSVMGHEKSKCRKSPGE